VYELALLAATRARLLGGERPLLLRTELDWRGRPSHGTVETPEADGGADTAKIFGRYPTADLERLGRGAPLAP
jgi:hypothetical protein